MASDSTQGAQFSGMWFRRIVLFVGILLCIGYAALLIPVGVNLPVSWPGLVLIVIGLTGGISCVRYFRQQRRGLLIPAAFAIILTIAIAIAVLVFGKKS